MRATTTSTISPSGQLSNRRPADVTRAGEAPAVEGAAWAAPVTVTGTLVVLSCEPAPTAVAVCCGPELAMEAWSP